MEEYPGESTHARGEVNKVVETNPNGNIDEMPMGTVWYNGRNRQIIMEFKPDGTITWRFR